MALVKPTIVTGDLRTFGGEIYENGVALKERYSLKTHNHDDIYLKLKTQTFEFVESINELEKQGSINFISDINNGVKLSFDSLSDKGHGLVLSNINNNTDPYLSVEGSIYAKNFKGNSDTATKLYEGAKINGVLFDGSEDIYVVDDSKLPINGGKLGGPLSIVGSISSSGLKVQSITGCDNTASLPGDLYLQHGVNKKIFLGSYGIHYISENGGEYTGNAATATILKNPKTISFTGDVSGAFSMDGGSDIICKMTVANTVKASSINDMVPNSSYVNNEQNALMRTDPNGDVYVENIAITDKVNDILEMRYSFFDAGDGFIRRCRPARMRYHLELDNVDNTKDKDKNVLSATKLTNPRIITLSGAINGQATFDGTANINIKTSGENINWESIKDKPEVFTPKTHNHSVNQIEDIAKVAISGSYKDLTEVPTNISTFDNDIGYITKFSDITGNAATASKALSDINGNNIIDTYATKNNTELIGIPTAPTADIDTNNNQIATTAFVKSVASQISGAMNTEQLETLKELNEILSNSDEPATSLINGLASKLGVDETAKSAYKLESGSKINDVLFDGSSDIEVSSLIGTENIGSNTKPSDYIRQKGQMKYVGLKSSSVIGLNPIKAGETSAIIGINKSTDLSLANVELAITDNGSIYTRYGTGDSWSNWIEYTNSSNLESLINTAIALTVSKYATIESPKFKGIPTVPTANGSNSEQIANLQYVQSVVDDCLTYIKWENIKNKPEFFKPINHSHAASEIGGLSNVAFSGNYNDLINIPTSLPASGGTADLANAVHWQGIIDRPLTFQPIKHTHDGADISGLETVAFTGSYNDLKDIPNNPILWNSIENKPKLNGVELTEIENLEIPTSKEIIMFSSSDSRWKTNSDGNQELIINTTKDALNIFKDNLGSYMSVFVSQRKTSTDITFISKDRFSGYIILI